MVSVQRGILDRDWDMTDFAACLINTISNMYSSEDFEIFYICCKAEGLPKICPSKKLA